MVCSRPVTARGLAVLAITVGLVAPAFAQPAPSGPSSPDAAVRAVLDTLFDAMRAGDAAAVRRAFLPGARLQSITLQGDSAAVQTRSAAEFARAVGQPREATWDERVWDVEVRVDGPMATAWAPYVFYLGGERSHCGVNAIHLLRRSGAWRIQQITYTRRSSCNVPQTVQK